MDKKRMEISPPPLIDPNLDVYDRAAVNKARDEFFLEQLIRNQEIVVLREKLKWCYRREGVNHLENCRHLSQQYLDLLSTMKDGSIKPFRLTPPATMEQ